MKSLNFLQKNINYFLLCLCEGASLSVTITKVTNIYMSAATHLCISALSQRPPSLYNVYFKYE